LAQFDLFLAFSGFWFRWPFGSKLVKCLFVHLPAFLLPFLLPVEMFVIKQAISLTQATHQGKNKFIQKPI